MKNQYEVRGDITYILLKRRDGKTYECIVDTEDLERIIFLDRTFLVHPVRNGAYAKVKFHQKDVFLHHIIKGFPLYGLHVDHINGNPLDNRKSNLRVITNAENQQNRRGAASNSKSGIRGVCWNKNINKWLAHLKINNKKVYQRYFDKLEDAEKAIKEARMEYMPYSNESTPSNQDGFFVGGM